MVHQADLEGSELVDQRVKVSVLAVEGQLNLLGE
jgi:hypothetical protein